MEERREAREEEAGTSARLLYWNATLCLMLSPVPYKLNMSLLPFSAAECAAIFCLLDEMSALWC